METALAIDELDGRGSAQAKQLLIKFIVWQDLIDLLTVYFIPVKVRSTLFLRRESSDCCLAMVCALAIVATWRGAPA
jgi:hypothetical protein